MRNTLSRRDPVKRSLLRRVLRGTLYVKLGLIVFLIAAFGLFYLRLSAAPMSFGRLPERVAEALAARIGPGWSVTLRNTAIELHDGSPALRANGLDIRAPGGDLVLRAPYAILSADLTSLLTANLQPKAVEVRDLQLRVRVNRDGSLSFSPVQETEGEGAQPAPAVQEPSKEAAASMARDVNGPSPVSGAVGSLLELIVGPGSVLHSLNQAQLTNARLVFIDADGRERARFKRVDAAFDWTEDGGRRFAATVEGPQGPWRLNGDATVRGKDSYRASIVAERAPITDILLLSGASEMPATTDLEFSGRFDMAFAEGRVTELKTRLESSPGTIQIQDQDTSAFPVEKAIIEAHWNEPAKALELERIEAKGGDTNLRVQGRLLAPNGSNPWRLSLNGRDIAWSGAAAGDRPLRVGEFTADLSGQGGVRINGITLKGPELSARISGLLAATDDPKGLRLDVQAEKTDIRSALRLWPEAVAPPVRRYLVSHLKAGLLESIDLKVAMTGADIEKALNGGPTPDESLKIDFAVSNGTLQVDEGIPPISGLNATGHVTGRKVLVRAPVGLVQMANDRSLSASEGTFVLDNYWNDNGVARIDFRLTGGADGLGALLLEPRIKEIAGFNIDPATMKGRVDLRVGIGLPVHEIPEFKDLPLKVTGAIGDFGVDGFFGKDRLEGADLTIAYDRGDLSVKGNGKLAGSAAVIDLQKNRQGGQASVAFSLDEAARNRRGLSFGSQLTGTIGLKASLPLGENAPSVINVEADLAKAGVDQLVPGWVKPVGRPGKLTFTMVEGPTSEIRDLQLDSGSVQLRGNAMLDNEGGLDKAELSTFKLSPGDDMRAQVERSNGVYKVTIRGNVGDARPFVKGGGATASGGRNGAAGKDSKDFDLDVNLNILTGFNEEAITNASVKASMRKDSLRQLDLKGRLGATDILGRTIPQNGGSPVVIIQAEDAGALLRFTDIYKRMSRGSLILQVSTGDEPQAGHVIMHSFALVNEPALRRIIPTQTQIVTGRDQAGKPQLVRVDMNEVQFTKARLEFSRSAGRLDFRDAAIWGNQIGFTLGGFIDYARDRLDVQGTFVPAYGLNNVFAQVPLFGPLLGGGQNEGLFAVNFRLNGQASAPSLSVNPLSAVAPGFLRKLFGVGAESAPQTGSLPAAPER
ncbi:DUF3971 domain-containing protein [Microvirga splendida]|uniref:DUF3971 domain-containing protein n=1 Tax=Microvirga splendida TaxID=2795727 RepID=A0ABS0Y6R9_9HYPH|nr:DUF3971 domain-containing protein [Microvirga splendida]MBJ6128005.1 hypothetical protein [Microvirga splendida]